MNLSPGVFSLVFRKILETAGTLLGLLVVIFILLKFLPGGPFDDESPMHPLVRAQFEKTWDLQGNTLNQFLSYTGALLRGDWGWSLSDPGQSVLGIIRGGFTQTFLLNGLSLMTIFCLGFVMALAAAMFPESRWARSFRGVTLALVSLPSFFLGPLLVWLLALHWDLLPVAFLDSPVHYILPVLTLSLRPAAAMARLLENALSEAVGSDYMRTARAKGLAYRQAVARHALRNSLTPVLGYSGPLIFDVLSGSFLVEVLFAVPGLGSTFGTAVFERNYPVILGLTLFYGVLMILISSLLDLALKLSDPRVEGETT